MFELIGYVWEERFGGRGMGPFVGLLLLALLAAGGFYVWAALHGMAIAAGAM